MIASEYFGDEWVGPLSVSSWKGSRKQGRSEIPVARLDKSSHVLRAGRRSCFWYNLRASWSATTRRADGRLLQAGCWLSEESIRECWSSSSDIDLRRDSFLGRECITDGTAGARSNHGDDRGLHRCGAGGEGKTNKGIVDESTSIMTEGGQFSLELPDICCIRERVGFMSHVIGKVRLDRIGMGAERGAHCHHPKSQVSVGPGLSSLAFPS